MSDLNPSLTCYVQPDPRVVSLRTNVVPGYITQRLEPRLPFYSAANRTYPLAANCVAIIRNMSVHPNNLARGLDEPPAADVVVQLQETNDTSVSGTRTRFGAVLVKPGGMASITFTPKAQFFEVKGVSGKAPVSIDIQTRIDWNEVGFSAKLDSNHPSSEWAPVELISESGSASQSFTSSTTWAVVHNLGFIASPVLLDSTGVDITALATFSGITTNGYTATFSGAKVGTAYSSK
jgi:hypothetical protein